MPEYRLSRLALADLKGIHRHTLETWGKAQAERYLDELQNTLSMLVRNPGLGRSCAEIRRGYRRMVHGSHVIFYRSQPREHKIEVVRILHKRMLPRKHFGEP